MSGILTVLEKFEYRFENFNSLADLFLGGILEVAIEKEENGRPYAVWFILGDRSAVKVTSIVSSVVDSWDEMGSLVFKLMDHCSMSLDTVILNSDWLNVQRVQKMVLKDNVVHAESGLVIENVKGEEIVVISSSFPYSIELFPDIHSVGFEPECDLDKYQRVSL